MISSLAPDIKVFSEILRLGQWHSNGEIVPNPELEYDDEAYPFAVEPLFDISQREMAAILADRCNPIRSVEPYIPIVSPRGLPQDLSEPLALYLRPFKEEDGFTFNWFTVAEVLKFELHNRTMKRQAFVHKDVAHLFEGCPTGFPLAEWPEEIQVGYAAYMANGIEVEWIESYADIINSFSALIPKLMEMGSPEAVRLIVYVSQ